MTRGIFPNTDSGLLGWSLNFSDQINSNPDGVGLSPQQAAEYAALHGQFAAAMLAVDPAVRSKTTTAAKNEARDALKNQARRLANLIYGTAGVTDAQKITLGLTVRKARTTAAVPAAAPQLTVLTVSGWTVKLMLKDATSSTNRGKPAGVAGASVFSYAGTTPPTELTDWKFRGNTGRTSLDVNFSSTLAPGTQVWLSAFWFNTRHESGPTCAPVSTNLQGGSVSMAA
jgi:hypothetical protein